MRLVVCVFQGDSPRLDAGKMSARGWDLPITETYVDRDPL